jgi:hypothetical protein
MLIVCLLSLGCAHAFSLSRMHGRSLTVLYNYTSRSGSLVLLLVLTLSLSLSLTSCFSASSSSSSYSTTSYSSSFSLPRFMPVFTHAHTLCSFSFSHTHTYTQEVRARPLFLPLQRSCGDAISPPSLHSPSSASAIASATTSSSSSSSSHSPRNAPHHHGRKRANPSATTLSLPCDAHSCCGVSLSLLRRLQLFSGGTACLRSPSPTQQRGAPLRLATLVLLEPAKHRLAT